MILQSQTLTFDATQDYVDLTWTTPFTDTFGIAHSVSPTDMSGSIIVWLTHRTSTGCRVNVSAHFSGTVELIGYQL